MHDVTDHLSAPPSSISDSDLLGAGETGDRPGGYRLIKSKTSSDACCTVFALNAISLWENQIDLLEAIHKVHPLVNLKEIYTSWSLFTPHLIVIRSLLNSTLPPPNTIYYAFLQNSLVVFTTCRLM